MSLERDNQSDQAVIRIDGGVDLDQAGTVFAGTDIDTHGFRSMQIAVDTDRDIADDEDIRLVLQDSADGVTFAAVPQGEILPTRNQDAGGQALFNANAPYLQTFGCTSVRRYVRIGFQAVAINQAISIGVGVIMRSEIKDFTDYDPTVTGDGMP